MTDRFMNKLNQSPYTFSSQSINNDMVMIISTIFISVENVYGD